MLLILAHLALEGNERRHSDWFHLCDVENSPVHIHWESNSEWSRGNRITNIHIFVDSGFKSHMFYSQQSVLMSENTSEGIFNRGNLWEQSVVMFLSLCSQWVVGENGVLKPKRVNPNVYQPPSLKGRADKNWFYRWWLCVVIHPCV